MDRTIEQISPLIQDSILTTSIQDLLNNQKRNQLIFSSVIVTLSQKLTLAECKILWIFLVSRQQLHKPTLLNLWTSTTFLLPVTSRLRLLIQTPPKYWVAITLSNLIYQLTRNLRWEIHSVYQVRIHLQLRNKRPCSKCRLSRMFSNRWLWETHLPHNNNNTVINNQWWVEYSSSLTNKCKRTNSQHRQLLHPISTSISTEFACLSTSIKFAFLRECLGLDWYWIYAFHVLSQVCYFWTETSKPRAIYNLETACALRSLDKRRIT